MCFYIHVYNCIHRLVYGEKNSMDLWSSINKQLLFLLYLNSIYYAGHTLMLYSNTLKLIFNVYIISSMMGIDTLYFPRDGTYLIHDGDRQTFPEMGHIWSMMGIDKLYFPRDVTYLIHEGDRQTLLSQRWDISDPWWG